MPFFVATNFAPGPPTVAGGSKASGRVIARHLLAIDLGRTKLAEATTSAEMQGPRLAFAMRQSSSFVFGIWPRPVDAT